MIERNLELDAVEAVILIAARAPEHAWPSLQYDRRGRIDLVVTDSARVGSELGGSLHPRDKWLRKLREFNGLSDRVWSAAHARLRLSRVASWPGRPRDESGAEGQYHAQHHDDHAE